MLLRLETANCMSNNNKFATLSAYLELFELSS